MSTTKSGKTYKLYTNGISFLQENEAYLMDNINTHIETAFFKSNALRYKTLNRKNYAFQFKEGKDVLLFLKCEPYNALIFGSKNLCSFAANILADYNVEVTHLLGENELVQEFLNAYQKRFGGTTIIEHSMQIMVLQHLNSSVTKGVFQCTAGDLDILAECYVSFQKEALSVEMDLETAKRALQGNEHNFYALAVDNKVVSIASKTRNEDTICAISHVFTLPNYRGHGYARNVVTKISQDILKEGKCPYLFVDIENPISNHLYLSMGFEYLIRQSQLYYQPATIKKAVFAGGCFWCLAEPYYSCQGVRRVLSGFVGGTEVNPTYKDVKGGFTHHKEAIMIEYDSTQVQYEQLIKIYFEHIDPFDAEGQFIDRGQNYTCGIYTSSDEEKEIILKHIQQIEKESHRKVCIELAENLIFYPAEEEHQDYALKNPQAMQEELEVSGRLKK